MKTTESYSGLTRLIEVKEKYFTHLGKTLSVISSAIKRKRERVAGLLKRIDKLEKNREETLQKIRVTEKNTIIYNINIRKINEEISSLIAKAEKVKENYDTLLKGPVSKIVESTVEDANKREAEAALFEEPEDITIDDNTVNLIDLEKKSFLRSIDTLFQQYEKKIEDLNCEKRALSLELDKLEVKLAGVSRKNELFGTIQKAYRDKIVQFGVQVKKEHNDLRKMESLLEEIIRRIKFASRLSPKARPLFTL